MDIVFDDGYEEDNQRSPASGNRTRDSEPSEAPEASAARSSGAPESDPVLPLVPHLKRTHHLIINGIGSLF